MTELSAKQNLLMNIINNSFNADDSLLIVGVPGDGKLNLSKNICEGLGYDVTIIDLPSWRGCFKSDEFDSIKYAKNVFDIARKNIHKKYAIIFDDFFNGHDDEITKICRFVHNRGINNSEVPSNVRFICMGNNTKFGGFDKIDTATLCQFTMFEFTKRNKIEG